jgi:hypothetical protein
MSALTWLTIGVWATCFIPALRIIMRFFAPLMEDGPADFVFNLVICAYLTAVGAPLIVAWKCFEHVTQGSDWPAITRSIAGESRKEKAARLERLRVEREAYIERLERELEIGR